MLAHSGTARSAGTAADTRPLRRRRARASALGLRTTKSQRFSDSRAGSSCRIATRKRRRPSFGLRRSDTVECKRSLPDLAARVPLHTARSVHQFIRQLEWRRYSAALGTWRLLGSVEVMPDACRASRRFGA